MSGLSTTFLVLGSVLVALCCRRGSSRNKRVALFCAAVVLFAATYVFRGLGSKPNETNPASVHTANFVTSLTCKECHSDEYDSWHQTYHRTMSQEVTPETVLGDFNNTEVTFHGLTTVCYTEGSDYFMNVVDPTWESRMVSRGINPRAVSPRMRKTYKIHRLVGSHNAQLYLSRLDTGAEVTLPLAWHRGENRWITMGGSLLNPPSNELYNNTGVWNDSCIFCHSTGPVPGLISDSESAEPHWSTHIAELGISCEACHGPGANHVAIQENDDSVDNDRGSSIVHPLKLPQDQATEICGRCHGKWGPTGERRHEWLTQGLGSFTPGVDRLASLLETPGPADGEKYSPQYRGLYWPDWTPQATGLEFQGTIMSKCYKEGTMTCMSCHSMHNADADDQLISTDQPQTAEWEHNAACTQCHKKYTATIAIAQHTHHAPESVGSQCINCHMPYQAFGVLKAVRTHRIFSPQISRETADLPVACNQCHVDQPRAWTAVKLKEWYGHETEDSVRSHSNLSSTIVNLLQGHALHRSLAAAALGWKDAHNAAPGEWRVPFLLLALEDDYEMVRLLAHQSLRGIAGFEESEFDYLADSRVRVQQVETLHEKWKANAKSVRATPALPIHPDGSLDEPIIKSLLQSQDRTPYSVIE